MRRSELTAQSRFQNSLRLLSGRQSKRVHYSLQAVTGTISARNPESGEYSCTTPAGVSLPVRNLSTLAHPLPRKTEAVTTQGRNYVDWG